MKFTIHVEAYMYEKADMFMEEADSLKDLLLDIMGEPFDPKEKEYFNSLSEEEIVELFEEGNGDGQQYYTIMNEDGEVVVGGENDEDF